MSNESITCADARDQLALLLYGELNFDEEERVELHIDDCADCRTALARQKELHAAIDGVEVTPSPALLTRCREEFFEMLHVQGAGLPHTQSPEKEAQESWWSQVRSSFEGKWNTRFHMNWLRPAGAVALLAIGFFAARVMPVSWVNGGSLNGGAGANYSAMDLAHLGPDQIRNVQADGSGRVNIILNETKQRTVSGNIQDAMIRNLLVEAARGSADPGLRAETVTILVNGVGSADVRDTLVFALENDQNAVVRWRAMEGLKSYTHDPSVQTALAQVLLQDMNPGMRTQAIDLLTSETGPAIDQQVVGVLQQMVSREDDAYVRQRAQHMLEAVKASAGVY
jgi:hypothetical protein